MTPWTVACQAPLSMEFSRQEYWSKYPLEEDPGDLPDPGIKLGFSALQADSLPSEPPTNPEHYGCKRCKLKTSKAFLLLLSLSGVQDVEARSWWVLWGEIPDFLGSSAWSPDQLC